MRSNAGVHRDRLLQRARQHRRSWIDGTGSKGNGKGTGAASAGASGGLGAMFSVLELLHEIASAGGASEDLNLDATPRSRTSLSSQSPSPPWPWALPRLGGMQKLEAERAESSEFYARFLLLLKLPGSAMAEVVEQLRADVLALRAQFARAIAGGAQRAQRVDIVALVSALGCVTAGHAPWLRELATIAVST